MAVVLVLVTGTGIAGETAMTNDVRATVEQAVQADLGWNRDEVSIVELTSFQMPPCRFLNVVNKSTKDPVGVNYAVLPGGQLVSSADKEAAARILDACAGQAKPAAAAWAEVLARFHPDVAPGTVVLAKERPAGLIQRLEAAGKTFAPPSIATGKDGDTVRFYLMNYESGILYEVTANRQQDGTLKVTRTKVS